MAIQVDHLAVGRWIRLLRPVSDAEGLTFAAGATWRIDAIAADTSTLIVTLRLYAVGSDATMRLDLRAPDGPRLGRMREWFEVVDPPCVVPSGPEPSREPEGLSTLARELRLGDIGAADARVRELAMRPRYAGENLQALAERLEAVARELSAVDLDRAAWIYEQAIDCWHGWGAMATSGGDGAARAPRIEAAQARQAAFLARA
ncbi:MAG: hypothetical protein KF889_19595 [Alphaproteobacteria bacterium]|nr:hypothetical protein [Alphaproteobacteria bacterium]MCW5744348.1 hypothetical protein [Alphaproteobacteria bacterium]